MQDIPLYKHLIPPPRQSKYPVVLDLELLARQKKESDDRIRGFISFVVLMLIYIFFATQRQEFIENKTRWMEKQGYSDQQIQQTLEDEYSDSEPSLENYSPE